MRKKMRVALAILLMLSLFVAPSAMAADADGTGCSLIEWVQDVLDDLFGGDVPENSEAEDDGNPLGLGPVADPAGTPGG